MPTTQAMRTWLKESFPLDLDVLKEMSSEPIPYHLKRWWFAVGGTPLYLFMIQAVTGIMLTFYYVPEPAEAYNSVARITNEVPFGWYLRSIHKWSANLMVAAVILHMLRVFFTAAYRKPREFNWMIGAGLLLTSCVFGFTGYSLIYEQISYWAAVVGTNIAEATPLIGGWLANFARGGPEVGANTLTRFFVFHIGVLPTVMVILLVLHVVQIRLHGVTRLRFDERGEPGVGLSISVSAPVTPMEFHEGAQGVSRRKQEEHPTFPFYPDHFYTELIIGLVLTFLLTILALVAPATMGEPANPLVTPEHIKPEWYFYATFRWLKLTSFTIGVVGTMIFVLMFIFWPFIDRWLVRRYPTREISFWVGVAGFAVYMIFTLWEAFV
ncbi:MAG: cytochrome bc complex cytochrome b subunit [candidate division KSB1 bacterium]|nr:cytochrome bc complex cytochrome b subunit [candidate division KSB1 bacterium]MDZ7365051.1 cytochrome bc complex cytochrome b subunit [candidate division KSB1 bacterium]MDZ7403445.1 cytochrome bc complex cytochrome b subunit [candidate division KSB1 bacterium]